MPENNKFIEEMSRRITKRRKELGLTQEKLAELADMTPQFVSYAESGKRAMRSENLAKLSKALGVSADYILTGKQSEKDLSEINEKLKLLTPKQAEAVNLIIDECIEINKEQ